MPKESVIEGLSDNKFDLVRRVLQLYPGLMAERDLSVMRLVNSGEGARIAHGAHAFRRGDKCSHFILLLEGSVRVQLSSDAGREVILYRVQPGGSCAITTSCLIGGEAYPAEGIIEEDVLAVMVPEIEFRRALAASESFRHFVFQGFSDRLCKVIDRVEAVTLRSIDERLVMLLLESKSDTLSGVTHQSIAAEIGTAREVVSRKLKGLQTAGLVRLTRGRVHIIDRAGLRAIIEK